MANKNITGSKVSVNKIVFGEMILTTNKQRKNNQNYVKTWFNGGIPNTK